MALVLVGCAADEDVPTGPDPDVLPAGVWEPVPGADILDASVALDGDRLWWAYSHRLPTIGGEYSIRLAATSMSGDAVVAPTEVSTDRGASYEPEVIATPSAIVAKLGGTRTLLRRYDREGAPLGAEVPVAIEGDFININDVKLIPTAAGGAQLFASLQSDTAEIAIVDFDADGVAGPTRLAGTPDAEDGGTVASSVTAAARPDGTTLVAWDRGYNACVSSRPSATLTTAIDGATIGPIQSVRDLPQSEVTPAIASSGSTAFIAWLSDAGTASRVALARYPDVGTVLGELETGYVQDLSLVLAAPDRGVLAWRPWNGGEITLVRFEVIAGALHFGEPRIVHNVGVQAGGHATSVVHVAGDRYLVSWIEGTYAGFEIEHRLYATELDMADTTMRRVPPRLPTSAGRPRLRCP